MNGIFKICLWLTCVLVISGCDTEIDLGKTEQKLVIEGFIEQGQYPRVYLTLSSGYYDAVDSLSLLDLIVPTARVAISDGENEEVLTLFRNTERFPPYYYKATDLVGEVGKTYTLEVISKGETYSATTTIPEPVSLDSIWFEIKEDSDSLGNIWLSLKDDSMKKDYYRVFTQTINEEKRFVPVYQSTFSDKTFNGEAFSFPLLRGAQSFTSVSDDAFYKKGTTVKVKFCAIDKAHFDFWRSLEQELYTTGNPFGSVGNEVVSNISGTKPVLGVWGGYAVKNYQIVIQ